ncbi:tyrosinase family oxidase copper chaperone [Streptomyces sp. 11x1]|uniref:tyrosinase family oxidase copper chaperone n=1 Tax=Streptomyces sp. 11x1 TaxID=3038642 RepID=UPI0037DA3A9F
MRISDRVPEKAVTGSVDTAAGCSSLAVDSTEFAGRRHMLRGLSASVAGMALAPFLVASGTAGPERASFRETYRGRRIVVVPDGAGLLGDDTSGGWHVTVDGRPLHLMRRVDGSWMTMVDHYQSYPTPLAAARAAVDELGPTAQLGAANATAGRTDAGGTPHGGQGIEGEHRHGVHA